MLPAQRKLSIIDILGDDGPSCELESSTHEGHVAFSIEGVHSMVDHESITFFSFERLIAYPQTVRKAAMYSASADDCATVSCFLDAHENAPDPSVNVYPEVLFISSTDPAQSLSVYP